MPCGGCGRRPALAGLTAGLLIAAVALGAVTVRDLNDAGQRRKTERGEAQNLLLKAEQDAAAGHYEQARDYLDQLTPRLTSAAVSDDLRAAAARVTTEVDGRLTARATLARFLALRAMRRSSTPRREITGRRRTGPPRRCLSSA